MEKIFNLFNKSVLLLGTFLLLFSCNEDKGNYDYQEINDLNIAEFKVKNAAGDYITKGENETFYDVTVEAGDNLILTPELAFISDEAADYSFKWYGYQRGKTKPEEGLVVSEEKDLIYSMTKEWGIETTAQSGVYSFAFEAINNKTEVKRIWMFRVSVHSRAKYGYVALCKKEYGFDVDIIAKNELKYHLVTNLFSSIKNLDLSAEPYGIETLWDITAPEVGRDNYAFYVLTDKITTRLAPGDYSYDEKYSISSIIEPWSRLANQNVVAKKIVARGPNAAGAQTRAYFLYNDDWYFQNTSSSWYYLDQPVNRMVVYNDEGQITEIKHYKPAPFVAINVNNSNGIGILFNETDKKIVCHKLSKPGNRYEIFYTQDINAEFNDKMMFTDAGVSDPHEKLIYLADDIRSRTYSSTSHSVVQDNFAIFQGPQGDYRGVLFRTDNNGVIDAGFSRFYFPSMLTNKNIKIWFKRALTLYCVTDDNTIYKFKLQGLTVGSKNQLVPQGKDDGFWDAGGKGTYEDVTGQFVKDGYTMVTCMKSVDDHNLGSWDNPYSMKIQQSRGSKYGTVIVGTMNPNLPKGKNGKMEFFQYNYTENTLIPRLLPLAGTENEKSNVFTGVGEIIDVVYKGGLISPTVNDSQPDPLI